MQWKSGIISYIYAVSTQEAYVMWIRDVLSEIHFSFRGDRLFFVLTDMPGGNKEKIVCLQLKINVVVEHTTGLKTAGWVCLNVSCVSCSTIGLTVVVHIHQAYEVCMYLHIAYFLGISLRYLFLFNVSTAYRTHKSQMRFFWCLNW